VIVFECNNETLFFLLLLLKYGLVSNIYIFVKKSAMSSVDLPYWMSRTELLLGSDKLNKLRDKNVLVVGLGGVGGICAEMIVRSGVGNITIVDADTVEESNRNRQIAALISTNSQTKAEVLGKRLLDINSDLNLKIIPQYIKDKITTNILESEQYDYVADCIDTLTPKTYLVKHCVDMKIKVISSLGAGGKVDPSQVRIADISESYNCKLGYYFRKKLHYMGIYKGVPVVFSTEMADKSMIKLAESGPKKSIIGTISYMPTIFGCFIASKIIRDLYQS